jgi:hypothetical protein
MSQLPVGVKPVCPIARLWEDIQAAPGTDTGTFKQAELEEPSKADNVLTEQADKMRAARVHMVATLEAYVARAEMGCEEAISSFKNATLFDDNLVLAYITGFATQGSRLHNFASAEIKRILKAVPSA